MLQELGYMSHVYFAVTLDYMHSSHFILPLV